MRHVGIIACIGLLFASIVHTSCSTSERRIGADQGLRTCTILVFFEVQEWLIDDDAAFDDFYSRYMKVFIDDEYVFEGRVHASGSEPVIITLKLEQQEKTDLRISLDHKYQHTEHLPDTPDSWVYVRFCYSYKKPDESYFKVKAYDHEEPFF